MVSKNGIWILILFFLRSIARAILSSKKKHLQRSHIYDILSQYFVFKISHLTAIQKGVIFSSGEKKASWQARFFLFVKQMLKASIKRKFDTCILLMF